MPLQMLTEPRSIHLITGHKLFSYEIKIIRLLIMGRILLEITRQQLTDVNELNMDKWFKVE